ncbi:hypothetical protein B4144_1099 [Bacillus atrophaeus]|nr:hypothetical protein B4144_1099 [Bacillus atrophaeus]
MVDFILLLKAWLYSSPYIAPDDGCSGPHFMKYKGARTANILSQQSEAAAELGWLFYLRP